MFARLKSQLDCHLRLENSQEALHAALRLFLDVAVVFSTPPLSSRVSSKGDSRTSIIDAYLYVAVNTEI